MWVGKNLMLLSHARNKRPLRAYNWVSLLSLLSTGHTSESLEALGAEIVVTFDGQSELGDSFMTRQSYLPSEIHWGCVFVNIIQQAQAGCMQHSIDLSR